MCITYWGSRLPLLLAPLLLITYTLAIYYWDLGIGRIAIQTPWFSLDESTPIILAYIFALGLGFIYVGMFLSWICRLPSRWRTWRSNRLLHKALTFYLFGLHDKALKKIEKCLHLQPKNVILAYMKGRILDALGQKTEAVAVYTSIKKYPLLKHHGLILLLKDDLPERHYALKAAFKLMPRSPFLHGLLARQKSYLTNAEDIVDYSRYVPTARGEIYALKGRLTKNPKWLKKAWKSDTHNLSIFHQYFKSASSDRCALKIAKKAFRRYPHPLIMQEILRLKNITDPLQQYVYVQKQGVNSPEIKFLLSRLKRAYPIEKPA